jgi:hypothetical protein
MPRVALQDSLQLCKISGCLYTPCIQDQQIFGFIIDRLPILQLQLRPIDDFFIRRTFHDLAGYFRIRRPLRGRHAYKASSSHVVCFNARGLLYECVFDALLFSSPYRPVGKPVSHHVVT